MTQVRAPLLAKSVRPGLPPVTLDEHLRDTEAAAVRIFRSDSRWGRAWLRFFRIPEADAPALERLLRVAALFHDIGKANEAFQARVRGPAPIDTIRHEHLSALVLCLPSIRSWLEEARIDVDIVTAAVLSHHLKAAEDGIWAWAQPRSVPYLDLRFDDPQIGQTFDRIAACLGTARRPCLTEQRWQDASPWTQAHATGVRAAWALARDVRRNSRRRSLLLATKAGLIVADAVASGVVRTGGHIDQWIDEVAHAQALAPERLADAIIGPRLKAIGGARGLGRPAELHAFQAGVTTAGNRVLLLASCGAGKTLAAWKWAEAQLRSQALGRVVFLYPTRGTATEGFRDYVTWAPESDGVLLHGTARYELDRMRGNPSEGSVGKDFSLREDEARLFALGLWDRRYFSATVDQFLSFLEHRYDSLCLLPALADAAVIIDEVHSFDAHMFGNLVEFLRHFDVPVLCMTATLPECQRRQLVDVGLRIYPDDRGTSDLADLAAVEQAARYRLSRLDGEATAIDLAISAHRGGRRVLWVVNTVARAQRLAELLSSVIGDDVLCYHSRFRLSDRQRSHSNTVAAFQQQGAPALAVTTQVCEMSLDLDADTLITEEAPVTSLVQRFGRANRRLARLDVLADLLTYAPEDRRPYETAELAQVGAFLAELDGRDISQRDLADSLVRHAPGRPLPTGSARFVASGYFAVPGDFRDSEDFSRPCLLDADIDTALATVRRGECVDGWLVPVPKRFSRDFPQPIREFPAAIGIADAARYSIARGFMATTGEE